VSAEIFVVCRAFRAPKYIDPKFLDPRHVFKDLAASNSSAAAKNGIVHNAEANVFQPSKQRRKRDGYDDNDYTLFKKLTVGEFVKGTDPVSILGSINKLSFETEEEKGYALMSL
jgi:AdoMet-dependent rRNA methyltransferase SPB1